MEQDPTLRLKALRGALFKTRFFDVLWQTFLYELNKGLIGTRNENGISRVSAFYCQKGLIGTEDKRCLTYVTVPLLLKPLIGVLGRVMGKSSEAAVSRHDGAGKHISSSFQRLVSIKGPKLL